MLSIIFASQKHSSILLGSFTQKLQNSSSLVDYDYENFLWVELYWMTHPGMLSNPKLREGTAFTTDNKWIWFLYPKSRLWTRDTVVAQCERPINDFLRSPRNEAKNLLGYAHLWAGSNVSEVPTSVIHWNWEFLPSTCKHRIVAICCHFNLLPYSKHTGNYCKLLEITGISPVIYCNLQ